MYLENNLILINILHQFDILDDFCVIKKILQDYFNPFPKSNPSLKSENPATCLCTIAIFRCVRLVPVRTLREVRVLENA